MQSFLLIGQSNMAGRGKLQDAHEIDTSRIYTLRNGRWQTMFRPIHPDRSFSGVCLAESFAEAVAKKYETNVGLICCADGGTSLDQWQPGELLFDNAVYQAKLAMRTSRLAGVLWHQGEAECDNGLYGTYQPRFERIMRALRQELGIPDVPFIVGGLGDFLKEARGSYIHVNHALERIAAENAMTGFASAEGLTSNSDKLHFNADSLYEFGLRYFDAFERLGGIGCQRHDNGRKEDLIRTEMELL